MRILNLVQFMAIFFFSKWNWDICIRTCRGHSVPLNVVQFMLIFFFQNDSGRCEWQLVEFQSLFGILNSSKKNLLSKDHPNFEENSILSVERKFWINKKWGCHFKRSCRDIHTRLQLRLKLMLKLEGFMISYKSMVSPDKVFSSPVCSLNSCSR